MQTPPMQVCFSTTATFFPSLAAWTAAYFGSPYTSVISPVLSEKLSAGTPMRWSMVR